MKEDLNLLKVSVLGRERPRVNTKSSTTLQTNAGVNINQIKIPNEILEMRKGK